MSIIPDLRWDDHKRLRLVVRQVHMKNYPDDLMTDIEADRIIESIAPEVLEGWLKAKIDAQEVA